MKWPFRPRGTPVITGGPPAAEALYAGNQWRVYQNMSGTFEQFRVALQRIVFSKFKWEGVSPAVSRAIEKMLIMNGRVCAVKRTAAIQEGILPDIYFGRLSIADDQLYDFYGYPRSITCIGLNGKVIPSMEDQFAIGFDTTAVSVISPMIPPIYSIIDELACKIYNAYDAWQVACETSKAAMIIGAEDDKGVKTITKVLEQVSQNHPYVVVKQPPQMQNLNVYYRNNTDHVKTFYDNYVNAVGAVMDLLGQPNGAPNKHERMIVGEMELDQSFSRYVAADRMYAREMFAEQVKDRCGVDIKPVDNLDEALKEAMDYGQVDSDRSLDGNSVSNPKP